MAAEPDPAATHPPGADDDRPPEGDAAIAGGETVDVRPREVIVDRADLRGGALTVLGCLLLGVVVALLWWWRAPREMVVVVSGGADPVDAQPGAFFAADLWFLGIGAAAGVLVGVIGLRLAGTARIGLLVGGAIGGVVGSILATWLGERWGAVDLAGLGQGTVLDAGLRVRATGVLLAWPIVTVAFVGLVTLAEWFVDRQVPDPLGTT
ncbi:MAG: hypothetical protein EPO13_01130 [Actinomycetota bacterium]|nr:MAG: hypothetical protein EPO13_01130 [Actinomycetota bacterium]